MKQWLSALSMFKGVNKCHKMSKRSRTHDRCQKQTRSNTIIPAGLCRSLTLDSDNIYLCFLILSNHILAPMFMGNLKGFLHCSNDAGVNTTVISHCVMTEPMHRGTQSKNVSQPSHFLTEFMNQYQNTFHMWMCVIVWAECSCQREPRDRFTKFAAWENANSKAVVKANGGCFEQSKIKTIFCFVYTSFCFLHYSLC